jgi:D-threo-aldose 1-dehydrogenase
VPDLKETNQVANTGLELGLLGLGVATQGGLLGEVTDTQARAVFAAAWEAGIRYFDTAPWYGLGLAEDRLGKFLQGKKDYLLSSKVGWLLCKNKAPYPTNSTHTLETATPYKAVYDASYDGFLRSFEESLKRLGVSNLDILYIHDPDAVGITVKDVMSGGGKALVELRQQGVIKAIGVGMNQWEMPLEFVQTGAFDMVLLASRYTLLEQQALPLMNYCAEHDVSVVIAGVYNTGLLANPQAGAPYNYAAVPPPMLERALKLKNVCEAYGVSLKAAALQFPVQHPAVVSVLTASRTVHQLAENLEAFRNPVPFELWKELEHHQLLTEEVLASMKQK